jgi:hypothetical protein
LTEKIPFASAEAEPEEADFNRVGGGRPAPKADLRPAVGLHAE